MTSLSERDYTSAEKCAWQRIGDDTQKVRYSPTATVRAFRASQAMGKAALNEQGCNSREVVLTAARLKPTFCNLTF